MKVRKKTKPFPQLFPAHFSLGMIFDCVSFQIIMQI